MGLFKKIFKPVSKVLDKVIPNEIKPALPYLAAFAPVFGPPGVQNFIGETMKRRMLTSGLLNIGAQLSQEGSEGDINLLSAGIGALSGAMTAPGASDYFSMRAGLAGEGTGLMSQAQKFGFDTLARGSDFLKTGGIDTAGGTTAKLLSTEGAKVATLPAATATGDVLQAQGRQLEKQAAIDAALAEAEALADSGARGDAIRNAMSAYGFFTDDEIEETVSSAGYRAGGRVGFDRGGLGALGGAMKPEEEFKFEDIVVSTDQSQSTPLIMKIGEKFNVMVPGQDEMLSFDSEQEAFDYMKKLMPFKKGGRVGFKFGGIDAAIKKVEDESIKESAKMVADMPDMDLMDLIEEFEIIFKRKPMNMEELKQFYRETYEMESPVRMKEKIKETITVEAKDGGLMNLGGKEMDLRGGGFVPIGKKERADDVPARLSKNEFVMTADAVRAAGGGSVNKGAKRMYNLMNTLEARA